MNGKSVIAACVRTVVALSVLFALTNCQRSFVVADVSAYPAAADSAEVWRSHPCLFPSVILGTVTLQDASSLELDLVKKGNALVVQMVLSATGLPKQHYTQRISKDVLYAVSGFGEVAEYSRRPKNDWLLLILWKNDTVVVVWNQQTAGKNPAFRHPNQDFIYRKIRVGERKFKVES